MNEYLEFSRLLLAQFGGGPGPTENNLVRFGLAAFFWAVLLVVALARQRQSKSSRERWLVWGFGIAMGRELFMFSHVSWEILTNVEHLAGCYISEPLEHALTLVAAAVVAGVFMHYMLPRSAIPRRYLQIGLGVAGIGYLVTFVWWPMYMTANPGVKFHHTWGAWLFHVSASLLLAAAIVILFRARGWLRNVVVVALACLFLGEFLTLVNYATDKTYGTFLCPLGNSFHILAIPLLGYVYVRELFNERQEAEEALKQYRNHLEELVTERTDDLTRANYQLQTEILEHHRAKSAVEKLSRDNQLILDSAAEGIFGVDLAGNHTFVNPAAARMLGYEIEELIGRPSHSTWHHSKPDGSPYPGAECPLHSGYRTGTRLRGDNELFWRKDGTGFPVRFAITPIIEAGEVSGAVVVFQDVTERKQAEAEIIQRNFELATQNAIMVAVSQSLDLATILNSALDQTLLALEMDAGAVFLLDPDEHTLSMKTYRGDLALAWLAEERCPCESIAHQSIARMKPVNAAPSGDVNDNGSSFVSGEQSKTLVSTPLITQNEAVGAMVLGTKRQDGIAPDDFALLTTIGWTIGIAVQNAQLHTRAKHVTALEERQRIAAEMHDGLAQTLSCLGHNVDQVADHVEIGRKGRALRELDLIRDTVDRASREVRQSIASLQEGPQPSQSLQDWLVELAAEFNRASEPLVELESHLDSPLFLPANQLEQVLRVVKEGLQNAVNHAMANRISLALDQAGDLITVTLADDGRGFFPDRLPVGDGNHFGLQIMRARAARIGGLLDIRSTPGQGTHIILSWNMRDNGAQAGPVSVMGPVPVTGLRWERKR